MRTGNSGKSHLGRGPRLEEAEPFHSVPVVPLVQMVFKIGGLNLSISDQTSMVVRRRLARLAANMPLPLLLNEPVVKKIDCNVCMKVKQKEKEKVKSIAIQELTKSNFQLQLTRNNRGYHLDQSVRCWSILHEAWEGRLVTRTSCAWPSSSLDRPVHSPQAPHSPPAQPPVSVRPHPHGYPPVVLQGIQYCYVCFMCLARSTDAPEGLKFGRKFRECKSKILTFGGSGLRWLRGPSFQSQILIFEAELLLAWLLCCFHQQTWAPCLGILSSIPARHSLIGAKLVLTGNFTKKS